MCSTGKIVSQTEPCYGVCPEESFTNEAGHITCYPRQCSEVDGWYPCGDYCILRESLCNDSCPDENDVIQKDEAGHLSCYPEHCPYNLGWFKCGDICTPRMSTCFCGNTTFGYDDPLWCCLPEGEGCIIEDGKTNCEGGQAIDEVTPCNGACFDETHLIQTDGGGNQSCYPDRCPYDLGWFMCGDICIQWTSAYACICGMDPLTPNDTLSIYHTQHYCCMEKGTTCMTLFDLKRDNHDCQHFKISLFL